VGGVNYPEVKLYLEVVKLFAVTGMIFIVLKRHRVFTELMPKRIVGKAFLFLVIFWLGFIADVSNDIYPTEFTKILDDIIISIALVFGTYLVWLSSRPAQLSVKPKHIEKKNGVPQIQSGAYLLYEIEPEEILSMASGKRVLFVTRRPERLRELRLPYIWVTNVSCQNCIAPTNLHILLHEIKNHMEKDTVIILDVVEYLVLENGFASVMKFLTTLRDIALKRNSTLILVMGKASLEKRERAIIEGEFQPLAP
jgi:hypothetical protein